MKAIEFHEFGALADVLQLVEQPTPTAGAGEVLVRLTARSINPSDVYTIQGTYGVRPSLPSVPGNEAAGVIEALGEGVTGWSVGDRVILMLGAVGTAGTWREYAVVKPQFLVPTPAALSDAQAACTWVNYLTAWIMSDELQLQPDEPVLVTAGASHLGRAMLQLSAVRGFKVVATVRKPEQAQALLDAGALGVITLPGDDLAQRWKEITGQKGIGKAIDAVAGETGTAVVNALAAYGQLIIYGLLSGEPIQVDGRIVFSEATIRGFWLGRWLNRQTPQAIGTLIAEVSAMFADGRLAPHVDTTVALDDLAGIVRVATEGGAGKVVITG